MYLCLAHLPFDCHGDCNANCMDSRIVDREYVSTLRIRMDLSRRGRMVEASRLFPLMMKDRFNEDLSISTSDLVWDSESGICPTLPTTVHDHHHNKTRPQLAVDTATTTS